MQSQAEVPESEEGGNSEIIKQDRGDQSARGAALRVIARQPASDTQCKQRNSGHAPERYRGGGIELRTEQQLDYDGGHGHQAQSRGHLDDSGKSE